MVKRVIPEQQKLTSISVLLSISMIKLLIVEDNNGDEQSSMILHLKSTETIFTPQIVYLKALSIKRIS